jgi:hypothetical protein
MVTNRRVEERLFCIVRFQAGDDPAWRTGTVPDSPAGGDLSFYRKIVISNLSVVQIFVIA